MSAVEPDNPIEVDARGLRCPLPVIRLAEVARDTRAGTLIAILTSDPAARHDIPAWCRMRGHELIEMTDATAPGELTGSGGSDSAPAEGAHPTYLRFVVQVQPQP